MEFNYDVLKIRNKDNTEWIPVPAIKGDKGDPYVLTDTDKQEIVEETINALPVYEGESEETGEASGGGTATGGFTVYTNPTEPVPIKNGSQIVFYVNQKGAVTLKIGNATYTVDFSDTTKSEWLLWLQSTNSGGSVITPTGTQKWMAVGGIAENILFSYSGTGELVVAVLD